MKQKSKDTDSAPTSEAAPKLILNDRHVINPGAPAAAETLEEQSEAVPVKISVSSTKPKVIAPFHDIAPPKSKAAKKEKPTTAPELSGKSSSAITEDDIPSDIKIDLTDTPIKTDDDEPETAPEPPKEEKKEPEPQIEAKPPEPKPEEEKPAPIEDKVPEAQLNGVEDTEGVITDDSKVSKDTQKALKEAEEADERNKKLEESIEKREYFVPINAVGQKRSIKNSALLTFAVFLLALVLVDMMLDTGTILLIQKVPHTHFFTTSSNNK